jgi:hypothetical protein
LHVRAAGVPAHCLEKQLDAALRADLDAALCPDLALVLGIAIGEVCQPQATSLLQLPAASTASMPMFLAKLGQ